MTTAAETAGNPLNGIDAAGWASLDCFTSTHGVLLRSAGYDPCILGDEWEYQYSPMSGDASSLPYPVPVLYRTKLREKVLAWYGLTESDVGHDGPADALAYATGVVREAGRPVIAEADTFHLRHTGFYRRLHYPHRIVIAGWAPGARYVVDAYQGASFAGWLPEDELLTAMTRDDLAPAFLETERTTTVELLAPVAPPQLPDGDRLLAALRATAERYLSTMLGSTGMLVGRRAIEAYIADLRSAAQSADEQNGDRTIDYLAFFGEVASQRRLNAAFLRLAARQTGRASCVQAAEVFEEVSTHWLRMRALFFAGGTRKRPAHEVAQRISTRLEAAVHRESAAVEELLAGLADTDG